MLNWKIKMSKECCANPSYDWRTSFRVIQPDIGTRIIRIVYRMNKRFLFCFTLYMYIIVKFNISYLFVKVSFSFCSAKYHFFQSKLSNHLWSAIWLQLFRLSRCSPNYSCRTYTDPPKKLYFHKIQMFP